MSHPAAAPSAQRMAAAMQRTEALSPAQLHRIDAYFHAIGAFFNVHWLALLPVQVLLRGPRTGAARASTTPRPCWCRWWWACSFQLLQGAVTALYLFLIGRRGLGLPGPVALGRALLLGLLAGLPNFGANYAAFNGYVFHG